MIIIMMMMKFSLLKSVIITIIIAGLTTNLMDYKHLCIYECAYRL